MQLFPAPPHGDDEVGRLQYGKMLAHRLPRHVETRAELTQRLSRFEAQPVEQFTAARIGQCLEHVIHSRLCNLSVACQGTGSATRALAISELGGGTMARRLSSGHCAASATAAPRLPTGNRLSEADDPRLQAASRSDTSSGHKAAEGGPARVFKSP